MLRLFRGVRRGITAWAVGFLLTYVLLSVGALAGETGVSSAATTYIDAHALVIEYRILVPAFVIGVVAYQAGTSLRTGVAGRIRSFVQSIRGTERNRLHAAATAAGIMAGSYAILTLVVALVVGGALLSALLWSLVYALGIGIPAAAVGAYGISLQVFLD